MQKIQQYSVKDVQILGKETLYQGFFKMVKYAFKHKLFEGGWSDVVQREVFERGHAVAVLPYDPVLDEFVMIEQFRIGALSTSSSPWLLEIVAGIIDEGETPEDAIAAGSKLYRGGDLDRGITACTACHGPRGNGTSLSGFPDISGQHTTYLKAQLEAFRSGQRANSHNGMMADIAKRLTDQDIDVLSKYISGLY